MNIRGVWSPSVLFLWPWCLVLKIQGKNNPLFLHPINQILEKVNNKFYQYVSNSNSSSKGQSTISKIIFPLVLSLFKQQIYFSGTYFSIVVIIDFTQGVDSTHLLCCNPLMNSHCSYIDKKHVSNSLCSHKKNPT